MHFASEPLWLDELHSAWSVDAEFTEVAFRARLGNQTPLFFWLSHCIVTTTGLNSIGLRLISLVCGTLSILIAGRFVLHNTNSVLAAITTATLVACDNWNLFYSSEARPYALLQLLALFQFTSFVSLIKRDQSKRFSPWLAALTFCMLATHLTAALLIATELLLLLAFQRQRIPVLITLAVGCGAALPILIPTFTVFENRGQWVSESGLLKLFSEWKYVLILQVIPAICLILLHREDRPDDEIGRTLFWPLLAWSVVPLLLSWLLHAISIPVAAYRYTTVSSLAAPICFGFAVTTVKSARIAWTAVALFVGLNLMLNPVFHANQSRSVLPSFRSEDWESAINFANQFEDGKILFLLANLYEDARILEDDSPSFQEYLKFPVKGIFSLREDILVIPFPTNVVNAWKPEQINQIVEKGGATILCRSTPTRAAQIEAELQNVAISNGYPLEFEWFDQPGNLLRIARIRIASEPSE